MKDSPEMTLKRFLAKALGAQVSRDGFTLDPSEIFQGLKRDGLLRQAFPHGVASLELLMERLSALKRSILLDEHRRPYQIKKNYGRKGVKFTVRFLTDEELQQLRH